MAEYIPSKYDWVRKQVELYEGSRASSLHFWATRPVPYEKFR